MVHGRAGAAEVLRRDGLDELGGGPRPASAASPPRWRCARRSRPCRAARDAAPRSAPASGRLRAAAAISRCSARSAEMKAAASSPASAIAPTISRRRATSSSVRRCAARMAVARSMTSRASIASVSSSAPHRRGDPGREAERRLGLVRDEGALSGARAHEAAGGQQGQRLAGHGDAHAEARGEVALVRQPGPAGVGAVRDLLVQKRRNLLRQGAPDNAVLEPVDASAHGW